MSQTKYRRKAVLTRIHQALDAFYLLQKIDWEYDIRATLEKILALAMEEIEFDGGRQIERSLIILKSPVGGELEFHAGWKADAPELLFSRTVVQQTVDTGAPILCENARDDPRFMKAESIKGLEALSLISVPIRFEKVTMGALYIESKNPGNLFNDADMEFLGDFTASISPYIKTALTHQSHLRSIRHLQRQIRDTYRFENIVGRSEAMQKNVFELVRIAAEVDRTVLLTGESGSGKELIARAIHFNGRRRDHTFIVVDCSSLSQHLLESELFGHRKGAFTGANDDKVGAFEAADGGTIFLDEISDAPKPMQQKLRRVLQEGEIRRVGENISRPVDVRVICATNKNLAELVEKGEFIRDLYFRMNKFPIRIPALRERREDIPLLVDHFLKQTSKRSKSPLKTIHPSALAMLMSLNWENNNVRELQNTVELAADFCSDAEVTPEVMQKVFRVQRGDGFFVKETLDAPSGRRPSPGAEESRVRPSGQGLVFLNESAFQNVLDEAANGDGAPASKHDTPFYRIQQEVAARAIVEGLKLTRWKLRPAAKLLGISPTKLRRELKSYLEQAVVRAGGDVKTAAEAAQIPVTILNKKAHDLGIESIIQHEDA